MANELAGKRVAFLVANEGVEEVELTSPWRAVEHAAGDPVLAAPEPGPVRAFNHLDRAGTFEADSCVDEVGVEEFDALVLPGGVANPDRLRTSEEAVQLVRDFFDSGRPVAAICHGPWTVIEAGRSRGRTLTSWPSLKTDIRNSGANWVDREAQVCRNGPNTLLTSRGPKDISAFNQALVEVFSEAAVPVRSR